MCLYFKFPRRSEYIIRMSDPLQTTWNMFVSQSSTIKSLSYAQYKDNSDAWNQFRTIELYNSNISTQRGQGGLIRPYSDCSQGIYYQFPTSEAKIQYKQGAYLYFYYLGYSNVVQKN